MLEKPLLICFPAVEKAAGLARLCIHRTQDTVDSSRGIYREDINSTDTWCWGLGCHQRWRARGKNCNSGEIPNIFPSHLLRMEDQLNPKHWNFSCFMWEGLGQYFRWIWSEIRIWRPWQKWLLGPVICGAIWLSVEEEPSLRAGAFWMCAPF